MGKGAYIVLVVVMGCHVVTIKISKKYNFLICDTHTHTHTHTHPIMYLCMYACMCVYIYIFIYIKTIRDMIAI